MKNKFFEYYPIDKDTINEIWDKGIFCYDANVLLNLYRYSEDTRNTIFGNIEFFIKRTIMPYQACYEYHKNRREVESSLLSSYDKIIEVIKNVPDGLESGALAGYRKHCALDIKKDIVTPLATTTNRIIKKIEEKKDNHTNYVDVAAIHNKITTLFDGIISDEFTEDELKKIYTDGKTRYEKKIPPGFADQKNKKDTGDNSLYGDLIIWRHLIKISKEKESDILFITDDRKEDWWDIYLRQTKGVRPELYKEFKEQTGKRILIYSVEDFMKYAPEHSTLSVPKKVISEIEELKKVDERRKDYLDEDTLERIVDYFNKQNRAFESMRKQSEVWDKINNQPHLDKLSQTVQKMNKMAYLETYAQLLEKIAPHQDIDGKFLKSFQIYNCPCNNQEEGVEGENE